MRVQEPVARGAHVPRGEVDARRATDLPPPRRHQHGAHRGLLPALRLEVDLQQRLAARKVDVSWPALMRDLAEVRAVEITLDGVRDHLRTDLRGHAPHAFSAAGVRPPPVVTPLEGTAAPAMKEASV